MLIDFLKTPRPLPELAVALAVIREFKDQESPREYLLGLNEAWVRLEQLEEYLAYRVEGTPLREDTIRTLQRMKGAGT